MQLLTKTIPQTGRTHSATVIFFHGSGDTGPNLIEWVRFLLGKDMQFPHIKLIYPTAPLQPYTPLGGQKSNVWFDRKSITPEAKECRKSIASIYESVTDLINSELNLGIPLNRIVVGGFSMGGALALHTGYHVHPELCGVFACSSFLNKDSIVYESLKIKSTKMESAILNSNQENYANLLMFHGERDTLVRPQWGRETFDKLIEAGVVGEYIPLKNTMHELKTNELIQLQEWLNKILPANEGDVVNKL